MLNKIKESNEKRNSLKGKKNKSRVKKFELKFPLETSVIVCVFVIMIAVLVNKI